MKRDNPESDCEENINRTWQLGGQGRERTMSHEKTTGGFKLGAVSPGRRREELVQGRGGKSLYRRGEWQSQP